MYTFEDVGTLQKGSESEGGENIEMEVDGTSVTRGFFLNWGLRCLSPACGGGRAHGGDDVRKRGEMDGEGKKLT